MGKIPEAPQFALDGSPMPTEALPKLTADEQTIIRAMFDYEPVHPPTHTCIYGDVGTGKTVSGLEMLWEVVPKDQYILYVFTANGWTSINNHQKYWGRINGQRRIKMMKYENQEQLLALAKALEANKGPFARIGGVMFDEFTHMAEQDQQWIVDTRVEQKRKVGEFKDPFVPALPDYLGSMRRTMDVVNAFTKLNKHLMFIGHERFNDKTAKIVPDFGDKTSKAFFRVLHSVYFADVRKRQNGYVKELSIVPDKKFVAKNRIGGLLGPVATIEQIVGAYTQWGVAPEEDTVQGEIISDDSEETPDISDKIEELTPKDLNKLLD